MLFVTCHDIYSKILSMLTKSVPKCLIYTHCFRARSLFIFGNLFFWTGMLHSSSSMSSYSISFSRTNRSSSIYLTPLPFSSTNARNLVEWAYTRYQVKPPYISTKCTMHALPWLIYCPLPKKQQSRRRRKTHIEAHLYAAGHISSNRRGFLVMIWTLPWC